MTPPRPLPPGQPTPTVPLGVKLPVKPTPSRRFRIPAPVRSLRVRLVTVMGAVALISALAAAGVAYGISRNAIIARRQNAEMNDLRTALNRLAPQVRIPPTQTELERLAKELATSSRYVQVVFGNQRGDAGGSTTPDLPNVPTELRDAVHASPALMFQRYLHNGRPFLCVGTPVLAWTGTDTQLRPSGLEVYVLVSLSGEENDIEKLAVNLRNSAIVCLLLAIGLGLLAASQVLRPVRELGQAARQLADGKLHSRVVVRGSDELAELARTFNSSAAALEETVAELRALEARARQFVADVSHELRTPLAAMVAVTDVLDEEADHFDDDAGSAARLASTETRKLARLVEDLIEISRFDAGAAALTLDDVDVAAAIRACLAVRGWSERVEQHLADGVVARVDPRRFDVIVANLVGNALRHGAPPVSVQVSAEPTGAWVTLRVSDAGAGLPAEVLGKVFDRFYKADSARARSEGSGLGLAIAQENAWLHGGDIQVVNAADLGEIGGAVFTVRLPRAHREEPT